MNEVILVPRRDDDGPRDALWHGYIRPWWEREQSHMPIIEGYHTDGPFSRSKAVNRAARLAGPWDVAVIIDADVVCDATRVKEAVLLAHQTGKMVLPHSERRDLSQRGSQIVIDGYAGSWDKYVHRRYSVSNGHPSVSSVVVIPRRLWDEIGGFDEAFAGWGFEDTAFAACAETFAGIVRMPGEVWHFWHPTAREGKRGTDSWSFNSAKGQRYRASIGHVDAIRALQAEGRPTVVTAGIPRILHRVVPEHTSGEVERWWEAFTELHPEWEMRTHRDPLDPADWPETSPYWDRCRNGAELADLVRLEALWRCGGIYVDSDVEPYRPLDSLLPLQAFAAWEDERTVPNAVMGAVLGHPAIRACLDLAIERIDRPTWDRGPGVTTAVLVGRSDVLLLPPGSFYPYHYRDKHRRHEDHRKHQPWAFGAHHWAGSWLPAEKSA